MSPDVHTTAAPWLHCYRRVAAPAVRIVCFPHAGGSASFFRPWVQCLPSAVELHSAQYPGRQDRIGEPFATDLHALAARYGAILAASDRPIILFGHSLGAAIAYEVARYLEASTPAVLLVVSGRQAPVDRGRSVHLMSDNGIWDDVARAGGTSEEVLRSPELRELMLPLLRADYRLSETYRPAAEPLLCAPVLACSGDADEDVDLTVLQGWGKLTAGGFTVRLFEGGHFYLTQRRRAVIEEIMRQFGHHHPALDTWLDMP